MNDFYFGSVTSFKDYDEEEMKWSDVCVMNEVFIRDVFLPISGERSQFGDKIYQAWSEVTEFYGGEFPATWNSMNIESLSQQLQKLMEQSFRSFENTNDEDEKSRMKSINILCYLCCKSRLNKILVDKLKILSKIKVTLSVVKYMEYDKHRIPVVAHLLILLRRVLYFYKNDEILKNDLAFMDILIKILYLHLGQITNRIGCPEENVEVNILRKSKKSITRTQSDEDQDRIKKLSKMKYYHMIYNLSFRIISSLFKSRNGVFEFKEFDEWMQKSDSSPFSPMRFDLNWQYILTSTSDFFNFSTFYYEIFPSCQHPSFEEVPSYFVEPFINSSMRIVNYFFRHVESEGHEDFLAHVISFLALSARSGKADLVFSSSEELLKNRLSVIKTIEKANKSSKNGTIIRMCLEFISSAIRLDKSPIRQSSFELLRSFSMELHQNEEFRSVFTEPIVKSLESWELGRFFYEKASTSEQASILELCNYVIRLKEIKYTNILRRFVLSYCVHILKNQFTWSSSNESLDEQYVPVFNALSSILSFLSGYYAIQTDLSTIVFGKESSCILEIMRMFYRFPTETKSKISKFLMWCVEKNNEEMKNFFMERRETDDFLLRKVLKVIWNITNDEKSIEKFREEREQLNSLSNSLCKHLVEKHDVFKAEYRPPTTKTNTGPSQFSESSLRMSDWTTTPGRPGDGGSVPKIGREELEETMKEQNNKMRKENFLTKDVDDAKDFDEKRWLEYMESMNNFKKTKQKRKKEEEEEVEGEDETVTATPKVQKLTKSDVVHCARARCKEVRNIVAALQCDSCKSVYYCSMACKIIHGRESHNEKCKKMK